MVECLAEVFIEGVEEDIFHRQWIAVVAIEFASALGLAYMNPIGGPVTGRNSSFPKAPAGSDIASCGSDAEVKPGRFRPLPFPFCGGGKVMRPSLSIRSIATRQDISLLRPSGAQPVELIADNTRQLCSVVQSAQCDQSQL